MPNKNYIKGRRKEYKFVNKARAEGKISFRSAGSHSCIDVVIIDILQREINFIQCKPDDMSENKKEAIRQANNQLNGQFLARFDVL